MQNLANESYATGPGTNTGATVQNSNQSWNETMDEESIFLKAIEIQSDAERNAFLDSVCHDNERLRVGVESLLRHHQDAGSFLEQPPAQFVPTVATGEFDTIDKGSGEISLDFLTPSDKPGCIGTLGSYEVVDVIGRGGMGLVLRAHDSKLNRLVAIKVMAPELAANPTSVKRFLREARAAAAVSHDHVVTIYAIEENHQPPFIVLELVHGQSLQERIDRYGALKLEEILRIGMQTARGLAAAHEQGLVHRDIKPANILLENGVERVKITDFGLARAVDDVSMTQTGLITGTPQFMSPEQAQGHTVDHRSDLFSLGSVLYTMCTGRPPFRAESAVAMLRRVCEEEPRPLEEVNSGIPNWLIAIIEKLLDKNPCHRFELASEVADQLGQHLAHLQHPTTIPKPNSMPRKQQAIQTRKTESASAKTGNRFFRNAIIVAAVALLIGLFATAVTVIAVVTDRGRLVVETQAADVRIVVRQGGEEVAMIDVKTGSKVVWLKSGSYEVELVGEDNDVVLNTNKFELKRFGNVVLTATWNPEGISTIRKFDPSDETITKDNVTVDDGGWKIRAKEARTVRLFEVEMPKLKPGPFVYRAKLKCENVEGRAYLEMWVRFPGKGEFFSKGFHNAIKDTNGWAEYEIPFYLQKGQQLDLAMLNLVVEGKGTVWIKDIEVVGRVELSINEPEKKDAVDDTDKTTKSDPLQQDEANQLPENLWKRRERLETWLIEQIESGNVKAVNFSREWAEFHFKESAPLPGGNENPKVVITLRVELTTKGGHQMQRLTELLIEKNSPFLLRQ